MWVTRLPGMIRDMSPGSKRLIECLLLMVLVLLPHAAFSAEAVSAAEDPARQVHWAMGAFFGTGWYRVNNNRNVYILRVPPSQTLRESSINADAERTLGIEIQYPVSFGVHNLDALDDFLDFDNYATVSFTPGVQVEIPVTQQWYLRPYANLGWGTEIQSTDSAWIFYGGIKSRYRLGGDQVDWSLLNSLNYAGYNPDVGSSGKYGSFMTGVEFDHPLTGLSLGGDDLWLNWHVTYNYMFDELNFYVEDSRIESIRDQWELGLALGKGHKKLKFWFLKFEHVGLSFKTSSNGVYKAISVNMRSPFTK